MLGWFFGLSAAILIDALDDRGQNRMGNGQVMLVVVTVSVVKLLFDSRKPSTNQRVRIAAERLDQVEVVLELPKCLWRSEG
jgi:hypothetical protein